MSTDPTTVSGYLTLLADHYTDRFHPDLPYLYTAAHFLASQPEPAVTEALRPWMDRDGGIHVDDPEDVPAFLEAVRATLATVPAPSPAPAAEYSGFGEQWGKRLGISRDDPFTDRINVIADTPPSAPAAEPSTARIRAHARCHGSTCTGSDDDA